MISVNAVRSNCYSDKENIWPMNQRIRDESIAHENDGDRDDTSHKDLNYVADKRSINGIGCEGDASTCFNYSRVGWSNQTAVSSSLASKLTDNR